MQTAWLPAGAAELSGLHVLISLRSAEALTVVVAVAVSSLVFGSNWSEETVTLFVMRPVLLEATLARIVKETLAPLARLPKLHPVVIVPEVQTAELDTNVTPAGNVSVTLTFVALEGPLLVTLIEYVIWLPAVTVAGPVLLMDKSAGLQVGKRTAPT